MAVRDSKDPDGPKLAFTAEAWDSFIEHIKHGQPGLALYPAAVLPAPGTPASGALDPRSGLPYGVCPGHG